MRNSAHHPRIHWLINLPAYGHAVSIENTLALPCAARRLIEVFSPDDVRSAIAWAKEADLPLLPLGGGSNVVLPPVLEAGVLKVKDASVKVLADKRDSVLLRVGAGKNWHGLVKETLQNGYFGLENLALIPGLVGAAPVQNIGAYGKEFAEFVLAVHGVDLETAASQTLTADDCEFTYRSSVFKQRLQDRFLISAVDIRLSKTAQPNIDYPVLKTRLGEGSVSAQAVFDAVVAIRRERLPDPLQYPNAGSFFKNPIVSHQQLKILQDSEADLPVYPLARGKYKVSAAWLIERAGLRGFSCKAAAVSQQHALVLVTNGRAKQSDVIELAQHICDAVYDRFAVRLEAEPRIYD